MIQLIANKPNCLNSILSCFWSTGAWRFSEQQNSPAACWDLRARDLPFGTFFCSSSIFLVHRILIWPCIHCLVLLYQARCGVNNGFVCHWGTMLKVQWPGLRLSTSMVASDALWIRDFPIQIYAHQLMCLCSVQRCLWLWFSTRPYTSPLPPGMRACLKDPNLCPNLYLSTAFSFWGEIFILKLHGGPFWALPNQWNIFDLLVLLHFDVCTMLWSSNQRTMTFNVLVLPYLHSWKGGGALGKSLN